jgi:hypothetical protein
MLRSRAQYCGQEVNKGNSFREEEQRAVRHTSLSGPCKQTSTGRKIMTRSLEKGNKVANL